MAPSASSFAHLLQTAVTDPGVISRAYQQFHTYSLGNQLLAMFQCADRKIPPGPMATYPAGASSAGRSERRESPDPVHADTAQAQGRDGRPGHRRD